MAGEDEQNLRTGDHQVDGPGGSGFEAAVGTPAGFGDLVYQFMQLIRAMVY